MKKLMSLVIVGIIMATMLTVTACGTKKSNELIHLGTGLEHGVEDGEIKWSRFHNYGTNNYDRAIEWREARKAKGEVVSEITWDNNGPRTYWFTAGKIAG